LPGIITDWRALASPAAVVEKLRASISSAVAEPAIADALLKTGGEPWTMTTEMTAFVTEELARFGAIVKLTGAKAQRRSHMSDHLAER
jgi:hypothetical protein